MRPTSIRMCPISLLALLLVPCCSSSPTAPTPSTRGAPEAGAAGPPAAGEEGRAAGQDGDETLTRVIAEVNGRPLYEAFYEQNLNFIRNRLSISQETADVERYMNAKFDALDMMVNDELIYQEAQRRGMQAPEDEVAAELKRMAAQAGGEGVFFAGMRAQSITRKQAIDGTRKRLTIDKFVRETIASGITVSDDEMLAHYNSHLERFTPEVWVKVSQIVIRSPQYAAAEQVQKARQRAEKILANIRAGEPFERMAREYSEHSNAPHGGDLGLIKKGAAPPEFEAIAFSIAPGQVSDVFRTNEGFHIIKVTERRGGVPRSFESVKQECRKGVATRKQAEAIRLLAGQLRDSARITTYLR